MTALRRVPATAKINLALVVGPIRADGKHELATVLQRVDLADRIELHQAPALRVDGFPDDTLVRAALEAIAAAAGVEPRWRARIHKRIPVAGGLGGGSSDAAAALRLANGMLPGPLSPERLHELARGLGADVPFFLADGPQLGEGDGGELSPLDLPQDYFVAAAAPARRGEAVDRRRLRGFRRARGRRGVRRAPRSAAREPRPRPPLARPRRAAAERPRVLAARRRAARPRRLPRRRQRRRADGLRTLRPPARRGGRGPRPRGPRPGMDHGSSVVRLSRCRPS